MYHVATDAAIAELGPGFGSISDKCGRKMRATRGAWCVAAAARVGDRGEDVCKYAKKMRNARADAQFNSGEIRRQRNGQRGTMDKYY